MIKYLITICLFVATISTQAQTVYKTPSRQKYHTATCRYVKNVANGLSLAAAQEIGLTACLLCQPNAHNATSGSKATQGLGIKKGEAQGKRATSVQCKGTTKKGLRCKRMTKNKNGYCFQHEPY